MESVASCKIFSASSCVFPSKSGTLVWLEASVVSPLAPVGLTTVFAFPIFRPMIKRRTIATTAPPTPRAAINCSERIPLRSSLSSSSFFSSFLPKSEVSEEEDSKTSGTKKESLLSSCDVSSGKSGTSKASLASSTSPSITFSRVYWFWACRALISPISSSLMRRVSPLIVVVLPTKEGSLGSISAFRRSTSKSSIVWYLRSGFFCVHFKIILSRPAGMSGLDKLGKGSGSSKWDRAIATVVSPSKGTLPVIIS